MRKKYLLYSILPALAIGAVGITASAHGMLGGGFMGFGQNQTPTEIAQNQQTQFQNEASLLGLSVDDVKNAWAKGESLQQLATDHNITAAQLKQKLQDLRLQQLKDRLNALVSQGVITQAQSDQRLQFMQQQMQNMQTRSGRRMRGMGMMF